MFLLKLNYAIIARMFIQLTRTDGVPVWLNACFVVTIEPRRSGGSIVVPIGDGLDYEVRESPKTVLAMLEGLSPVKVVPVPPPKSLTPRPDDVSSETNPAECDKVKSVEAEPAQQKKVRKTKTAAKKKATADDGEQADAPISEQKETVEKPAPKKKRATKKKAEEVPVPVKLQLPGDCQKIVDGLKSRKCRTVKRMRNAIKSFYGKTDDLEIDTIIEEMMNTGCIHIEADGHVNWIA